MSIKFKKIVESMEIGDLLIIDDNPCLLIEKVKCDRYELSNKFAGCFWQVELNKNLMTVMSGSIGNLTKPTKIMFEDEHLAKIQYKKSTFSILNSGYKKVHSGSLYKFSSSCSTPAILIIHTRDIINGLVKKDWKYLSKRPNNDKNT